MTLKFRPTLVRSLALLALVAGSAAQAAPDVPAALAPPAGTAYAFTWHARGWQIYECKSRDAGVPGWASVAPEAELFNDANEKVGSHGAGPHWAANDGSRITGKVKASMNGQRPGDAAWLRLEAVSAGGPGKMAGIGTVLRLNTAGGAAPVEGCANGGDAGKQARIPYTADYVFFSQGT
jgi:hypothetical protein